MNIEPISELRHICQASVAEKEGRYDHYYTRKVSIYLTKVLLLWRITANQATVLGTIIGISGSIFFLKGSYWTNIIGVLSLHLWHILDHSDGEIARYRKSCTQKGVFLDELSHNLVNISIFICIGFGLYAHTDNVLMFILGFIAAFLLTLTYNIGALKSSVLPAAGDRKANSSAGSVLRNNKKRLACSPFIGKLFHIIFSRSFFWSTGGIVWILLLCALFNKLFWALLFFACTTPFRLAFRIAETIKELDT